MAVTVNPDTEKRLAALPAAGLRPDEINVSDKQRADFAEECRRQSRLVALADAADGELGGFMDAAASDLLADTEA